MSRSKKFRDPEFVASVGFLLTPEWKRLRVDVIEEYGNRCMMCGRTPPDVVINVDHIVPRRVDPTLALVKSNLQILCGDCNEGKGNRYMTDWRPVALNSGQRPQAGPRYLNTDESLRNWWDAVGSKRKRERELAKTRDRTMLSPLGWTRHRLAAVGMKWPPQRGWLKLLKKRYPGMSNQDIWDLHEVESKKKAMKRAAAKRAMNEARLLAEVAAMDSYKVH